MLFGDSGPSHAEYAASQPLIHEPGTKWSYSSGTTNIVARIIGDIVNGSAGGDPAKREAAMRAFLTARLFGPAGMASAEPKFDGAGDFVGSSYVYASARDFMQFGELYRHDGVPTSETANGFFLPDGRRMRHTRLRSTTRPDTATDGTGGPGPTSRAATPAMVTQASSSWSSRMLRSCLFISGRPTFPLRQHFASV